MSPAQTQSPPLPAYYRIGIEAMDNQHARWIHLIETFKSIGAGHLLEPAGVEAARHAIEQLLEYTKMHFASEEELLKKVRFPGLEAHRLAHRKLETAVIALADEIHAHRQHLTPLKLNLLATIWLMEHIDTEDRQYARFILDAQASKP